MSSSRIPGFYELSLAERRRVVAERSEVELAELEAALDHGGLLPEAADKIVENVLGTYSLPFGVALNFRINGRDRLVPMVVEEPSVIAAASNAARMVRECGGFRAEMVSSLMTAQIQLHGVGDVSAAIVRLRTRTSELLELAQRAVPNLVARGGGPRSLELRDLGEGYLVVHIQLDCRDAMGANLVNAVAEAVGPQVQQLAGGELGLRILTNLCDGRRVRVECQVATAELIKGRHGATGQSWAPLSMDANQVGDAIVRASDFAWRDPYRAATHNKGLMNGVDSVVLATGNDYRAVEAGVHAYAAESGAYRPVSRWRREGGLIVGDAEFPLALGVVGGTLRVHPAARLALKLAGIDGAADLCGLAASAGLASNLAALRALATEGIQRGHMSLHARSVATLAGAAGAEVEAVAASIAEAGTVSVEVARQELARLRGPRAEPQD